MAKVKLSKKVTGARFDTNFQVSAGIDGMTHVGRLHYTAADSLVAHWRFTKHSEPFLPMSSGSIRDLAGNGHHASYSGLDPHHGFDTWGQAAASVVVTFIGTGLTNGETILITSTDGTAKTYTYHSATQDESEGQFTGATVIALAANLQSCIDDTDFGHTSAKLTTAVSAGVLTLTQVTKGHSGNTTITHNMSPEATLTNADGAQVTGFTGGNSDPTSTAVPGLTFASGTRPGYDIRVSPHSGSHVASDPPVLAGRFTSDNSWISAPASSAFHFVDTDKDPHAVSDGAFSFATWVKAATDATFGIFALQDPTISTDHGHRFYHVTDSGVSVLYFELRDGPLIGDVMRFHTADIEDQVANAGWVHLAVTYDGSGGDALRSDLSSTTYTGSGIKIYINGYRYTKTAGLPGRYNSLMTNTVSSDYTAPSPTWMSGSLGLNGHGAVGTVTFTGVPADAGTVTIISTDGTSKAYYANTTAAAQDLGTDPPKFYGSTLAASATSLKACIDSANGHGIKASTTVTVADGDAASGMSALQMITIISTDGTSRKYVLVDGDSTSVATGAVLAAGSDYGDDTLAAGHTAIGGIAVAINLPAHTQNAYLVQLKAAIEHANGHNGKIVVGSVPSQADGNQAITLTQLVAGSSGNTTVTGDATNVTVANFTGGSVKIHVHNDGAGKLTLTQAVPGPTGNKTIGDNATALTAVSFTGGTNGGQDLILGHLLGASSASTYSLDGEMFEPAMWSAKLSDEDVRALYYAGLNGVRQYRKQSGFLGLPPRVEIRDRDNQLGAYPTTSRQVTSRGFTGRFSTAYDDSKATDFLSSYASANIKFLQSNRRMGGMKLALTGSQGLDASPAQVKEFVFSTRAGHSAYISNEYRAIAYVIFYDDIANGKTIEIISTDGTSRSYTAADTQATGATPPTFTGNTATLAAASLEACIEAAANGAGGGHGGKITVENLGTTLKLTQATLDVFGDYGNTVITTNAIAANMRVVKFRLGKPSQAPVLLGTSPQKTAVEFARKVNELTGTLGIYATTQNKTVNLTQMRPGTSGNTRIVMTNVTGTIEVSQRSHKWRQLDPGVAGIAEGDLVRDPGKESLGFSGASFGILTGSADGLHFPFNLPRGHTGIPFSTPNTNTTLFGPGRAHRSSYDPQRISDNPQNLEPYREDRLFAQFGHTPVRSTDLVSGSRQGDNPNLTWDPNFTVNPSLSGPFYSTGSDPAVVGPGISAPLWDKHKIEIDLTPASATTHVKWTANNTQTADKTDFGPMMYFNFDKKKWERIGTHQQMPSATSLVPTSQRGSLPEDRARLRDVLDTVMVGFGQSHDQISQSSSIANASAPGFKSEGKRVPIETGFAQPTNTFGFPFHPKFAATGSQVFDMTGVIDRPFLVEKMVYEFSASLTDKRVSSTDTKYGEGVTFFILNQRMGNIDPGIENRAVLTKVGDTLPAGGVGTETIEVPYSGTIPTVWQLSPHSSAYGSGEGYDYETITGTTTANDTLTITGVGTAFKSDLKVGDSIQFHDTSANTVEPWARVMRINSDTEIVVEDKARQATSRITIGVGGFPASDLSDALSLTSADGETRVYTAATATTFSYSNMRFNAVGTAELDDSNKYREIAEFLKRCIEHPDGHNGKIQVSRQDNVLILTQATAGAAGNTAVLSSLGYVSVRGVSLNGAFIPYVFAGGIDAGGVGTGNSQTIRKDLPVKYEEVGSLRDLVTFSTIGTFTSDRNKNDPTVFEKYVEDVRSFCDLVVDSPVKWAHQRLTLAAPIRAPALAPGSSAWSLGANYISVLGSGDVIHLDTDPDAVLIRFTNGSRNGLGIPTGRAIRGGEFSGFERAYSVDAHLSTFRLEAPKQDSVTSPYLLLPGDKLVFGFQAPISYSAGLTVDGQSDQYGKGFSLHPGAGKLVLYGSVLRNDQEVVPSSNQPLTSEAVHETLILGTDVYDQYDTEPSFAYSGSYLENVVAGHMMTGSLPTSGSESYLLENKGEHRRVIGRVTEGTAGVTGSFLRGIKLIDHRERYYDTLLPSIAGMLRANGDSLFDGRSLKVEAIVDARFFDGDGNEVEYGLSLTPNAGMLDPKANVLVISEPRSSIDGPNGIFDRELPFFFPFEPKYAHVGRLASEKKGNKQFRVVTGSTGRTIRSGFISHIAISGSQVFLKSLGLQSYLLRTKDIDMLDIRAGHTGPGAPSTSRGAPANIGDVRSRPLYSELSSSVTESVSHAGLSLLGPRGGDLTFNEIDGITMLNSLYFGFGDGFFGMPKFRKFQHKNAESTYAKGFTRAPGKSFTITGVDTKFTSEITVGDRVALSGSNPPIPSGSIEGGIARGFGTTALSVATIEFGGEGPFAKTEIWFKSTDGTQRFYRAAPNQGGGDGQTSGSAAGSEAIWFEAEASPSTTDGDAVSAAASLETMINSDYGHGGLSKITVINDGLGKLTLVQAMSGPSGSTTELTAGDGYDETAGLGSGVGTVVINFVSPTDDGDTITIVSTDGTSRVYTFGEAQDLDASPPVPRANDTDLSATSLAACIAADTGHSGKVTVADDLEGVLTLTQVVGGTSGNTTVTHNMGSDVTLLNTAGSSVSGFTGGVVSPTFPGDYMNRSIFFQTGSDWSYTDGDSNAITTVQNVTASNFTNSHYGQLGSQIFGTVTSVVSDTEMTVESTHSNSTRAVAYIHCADGELVAADGWSEVADLELTTTKITSTDGTVRRYILVNNAPFALNADGDPMITGRILAPGDDTGIVRLTDTHTALGGIAVAINCNEEVSENDYLVQLKAAIQHADGHNGKITVGVVPAEANEQQTIGLVQKVGGTGGNTTITSDTPEITATSFTGGGFIGDDTDLQQILVDRDATVHVTGSYKTTTGDSTVITTTIKYSPYHEDDSKWQRYITTETAWRDGGYDAKGIYRTGVPQDSQQYQKHTATINYYQNLRNRYRVPVGYTTVETQIDRDFDTHVTGAMHIGVGSEIELRGFKYGIANIRPLYSSAVYRHDRFGQVRDLLEQRQFTRFFTEDGVEPGPVKVTFTSRPDDEGIRAVNVDPETTHSQNLDIFCSSSLPYFDGLTRDRASDPDKAGGDSIMLTFE